MKVKVVVTLIVFSFLSIFFQNCDGFNALNSSEFSSLSGKNPNNLFVNFSNNSEDKSLSFLANSILSNGYIFYGEYGANPNDKRGSKVCDYPSLGNCRTKEGDAVVANSGLNPNSNVHMLAFDFQSNSYFKKNPGAHFAVGLRGFITRNKNGDMSAVNGRGFIVGTLGSEHHQKNAACGTNMMEIETYHGDASVADPKTPANHVFNDSCSDSIISDGKWYHMELYVSLNRKIGYKVYDDQSKLIYTKLMQDPYNYISPSLNDFFFGHVFDNEIIDPSGNWSIIIRNVRLGASESTIEEFFRQKILNLSLGNQSIANNAVVDFEQMKSKDLLVGPFASSRTRIFACANPASEVDAGRSCRLQSDFRAVNFSGDTSFVKVGSSLKVLSDPILDYPPNIYKLIFRINPESSEDQAVVQIDTRSQLKQNPAVSVDSNVSQIVRYYSTFKANHFFKVENLTSAIPESYNKEAVAFSIYNSPGNDRFALQLCATRIGYFLSTAADCEQQTVLSRLGYISKTALANLRPLYRCVRSAGHLSTVYISECNNNGYRVEGVLGYIP